MRLRSLLAPLLVTVALLAGAAAPAAAAGPGTTFLTGGLDLPAGAIAGGMSGYGPDSAERASVSADGRYVAFVSDADTFDPAANPDVTNVYRKDRLTGEVLFVSRATGAGGAAFPASSVDPVISDDGTRVAFRTTAALSVTDADGGRWDVYVRDVPTSTTILASLGTGAVQTATDTYAFDLSGDREHVAFTTKDRLDGAHDGNTVDDVYLRNLRTGTTTLVTINPAGTAAGDAASTSPSISRDGAWVAFATSSTNLAAPYTAGSGDQIFVRDVGAPRTYLVSARQGASTTGSNGSASEPAIAGGPATTRTDRVFVAYTSSATDVAPADDSSTAASVYARQLSVGNSVLVSRADGAAGANADSRAHTASISDDATRIVFSSDATNLGAGADYYGTYLRDLRSGRTLLASADNLYAVQGTISADGSFVTWDETGATADSDPDYPAVFGRTYDSATSTLGAVALVSRPPGSAAFLSTWIAIESPASGSRWVSADGRYIVFRAFTTRLPGGRAGGPGEVYRRDVLTGAVELVSRATGANGAPADRYSVSPSISADGTRVAFVSYAHLDPAHTDSTGQIYVRDFAAGTTTLVSRADGPGGALPNDDAYLPAISADGTRVAFVTNATNMGTPGTDAHVYLRTLANGATQLVDRANGPAGTPGNGPADFPSLSRDGRLVAFSSQASNLDAADPDRFPDIYLRDTVAGTTALLSRRSGLDGAHATRPSNYPAISADGGVVAFRTSDETLAPEAGPWGGFDQVVARTVATGANALASRAPGGAVANDSANHPSVSGDGSVVAFDSAATNLLVGVGGFSREGVFARTMTTGALSGPPAFGLAGDGFQNRATYPAISDDGQCMAFAGVGHNAITGTAGDDTTTYMHVVSGVCPKPLPPIVRPIARARRPELTRASLSHKRFRVGRRATAQVAGAQGAAAKRGRARRAPIGTTFRFTLNTRANVAIALERQAPGRLVGRFCKRPAHRLRRHLRCFRWVRAGRLSRGGLNAGANRVAFSGRISRKALKRGSYRARLRASSAGGTSRWVTLKFAVVRR
ncbi:MAG: TolB family protein [Conexibacter sp.]